MAVAFLPLQSMGQEKPADKVKPEKPQKVTVTPYGFIRNYLNFDSRRTITSCGGEYLMIPYDEDWNITPEEEAALIGNGVTAPEGTDLRFDRNAMPQAHLLALSSRFGLNLNGPGIWVWQSSNGKLEADFAGFGTNNTVLRLRLAYLQLTRGGRYGQSLTIGQNWHPLSFIPDVLGMAAGAPFRAHSRTPQVQRHSVLPSRLCGSTSTPLPDLTVRVPNMPTMPSCRNSSLVWHTIRSIGELKSVWITTDLPSVSYIRFHIQCQESPVL